LLFLSVFICVHLWFRILPDTLYVTVFRDVVSLRLCDAPKKDPRRESSARHANTAKRVIAMQTFSARRAMFIVTTNRRWHSDTRYLLHVTCVTAFPGYLP